MPSWNIYGFCDKNGGLFYDKRNNLCDKSSKLRQN